MDPDAAYLMMLSNMVAGCREEAAHTAVNLTIWIDKGGFVPKGFENNKHFLLAFLDWVVTDWAQ